jgi:hypothetical protein
MADLHISEAELILPPINLCIELKRTQRLCKNKTVSIDMLSSTECKIITSLP